MADLSWNIDPNKILQYATLWEYLINKRKTKKEEKTLKEILPKILKGEATEEDISQLNPETALKLYDYVEKTKKNKEIWDLYKNLLTPSTQTNTSLMPPPPPQTTRHIESFVPENVPILTPIQMPKQTKEPVLPEIAEFKPQQLFNEDTQKKLILLTLLGNEKALDLIKTNYYIQESQAKIYNNLIDAYKVIKQVQQGEKEFEWVEKEFDAKINKINKEIEKLNQEKENLITEGKIKEAQLLEKQIKNTYEPILQSLEIAQEILKSDLLKEQIKHEQARTTKTREETKTIAPEIQKTLTEIQYIKSKIPQKPTENTVIEMYNKLSADTKKRLNEFLAELEKRTKMKIDFRIGKFGKEKITTREEAENLAKLMGLPTEHPVVQYYINKYFPKKETKIIEY